MLACSRLARACVLDRSTKKTYNYKCHRDGGSKPGGNKYSSQPTQVYSVNDIAFNSINTFATVGSDGVFAFWDKDARSRLSIHERFKYH